MPKRPSTPCPVSRCPHLRPCPVHKKEREKPHYYKWYYSKEWRALRRNQLRLHPYCGDCREAGKQIISTEVDHVEEHKGDPLLFFNQHNLDSKCKSCHSRKTMRGINEEKCSNRRMQ